MGFIGADCYPAVINDLIYTGRIGLVRLHVLLGVLSFLTVHGPDLQQLKGVDKGELIRVFSFSIDI